MFNLIKLVGINLLTFLDIYKIKNAKTFDEKKKAMKRVLFILAGLFAMSYSVYYYLESSMKGYVQLNIPYVLLGQVFAIVSSFMLFTGFYKVNSVLFGFKDYDMLMSLPIKRRTIILSKIMILYTSNFIYTLLFMIPAYILYIMNVDVNLLFHILFFLTLFILPILPIIISTIIGSIIVIISNRFRLKKIMNMVFSLIFVFGIMYGSYKLQNMPQMDLVNIGKSMVKIFNRIYPLTGLYIDILKDFNIKSLLIFISIPIVLLYIYTLIINKKFISINNALAKEYTKNNYKIKTLKTNSVIISLYKKEIKRFFNSVNYVLNASMGSITLTLSVVCLIFFGKGKIDDLLQIKGLSDLFIKYGPIMLASFCLLNCTTHPSISLEGKNVWILKSSPITAIQIFYSKILVNLTILVPTIIINATMLSIYLKLSIKTYILCLILPLLYSLFISMFGIIANCFFINYDFKNEIQVIKQSPQAIITVGVGFLFAFLPFMLKINLNKYIYVIILIAIVLNIILYIFMRKVSTKQFYRA